MGVFCVGFFCLLLPAYLSQTNNLFTGVRQKKSHLTMWHKADKNHSLLCSGTFHDSFSLWNVLLYRRDINNTMHQKWGFGKDWHNGLWKGFVAYRPALPKQNCPGAASNITLMMLTSDVDCLPDWCTGPISVSITVSLCIALPISALSFKSELFSVSSMLRRRWSTKFGICQSYHNPLPQCIGGNYGTS